MLLVLWEFVEHLIKAKLSNAKYLKLIACLLHMKCYIKQIKWAWCIYIAYDTHTKTCGCFICSGLKQSIQSTIGWNVWLDAILYDERHVDLHIDLYGVFARKQTKMCQAHSLWNSGNLLYNNCISKVPVVKGYIFNYYMTGFMKNNHKATMQDWLMSRPMGRPVISEVSEGKFRFEL